MYVDEKFAGAVTKEKTYLHSSRAETGYIAHALLWGRHKVLAVLEELGVWTGQSDKEKGEEKQEF